MTDTRLHTDRRYTILTLAVILAGCVAGFSGVNLGMPGAGDESYQALCVADYRNNPLGMLSFYIGHLWQNIFGATVLSLRCLASLEMLLAVGLGSLLLYRRTGRALMSAGVFAVSVTVARASAFQLYNWDSGSYLFDAVALVAVASFLRHGDPRKVFAAGIAVACMALARVPSAVFAPIIFGFVWAGCRRHGFTPRATALCLGAYTATALATAALLTTLMCGSPADYLAAFRPENLVGGHSPADLPKWIERIGYLGYNQIIWMTPSALALAAAVFIWRMRQIRTASGGCAWPQVAALAVVAALAFAIYRHRSAWCLFEWNSLGADLPLLLFILALMPAWNLTHTRRIATPRLQLWWCAVMAVMMTFGSDTFFERMCGGFILPVVLATGYDAAPEALRRLARCILLMSLAVFGTMVAEQWVMKAVHNTATPPARYEALHGLKVPPEYLKQLEVCEAAANSTRTLGMRHTFCGSRFLPQLLFGRDNGPRLAIYWIDYENPQEWPREQIEAVDSADILIDNSGIPADSPTARLLPQLGFCCVLDRHDVRVFARHRRAPEQYLDPTH